MLSIIGLITILIIVAMLLRGKVIPVIPLVVIPVVAAFVAGFSIYDLAEFFDDGIDQVIDVAIMFIFAILYFGIMQSAGLFDPLIQRMIRITHGNIIVISIVTVLIAAVAQLDGSGASTFLITIPALLPLYQRMKMNPYLLLLLIGGSASVMNMLPWAGPLGRAASVLDMDVTELWRPLIPIQIIGMLLMLGLAILLGYMEKRRIEKKYGKLMEEEDALAAIEETEQKEAGSLIWFNLVLTIAVIGVLVWGVIPAGFVFMIGVSIALPLNYQTSKEQGQSIHEHAPGALTMGTIILGAGVFLGILTGTGMLDSIATDAVKIIPGSVTSYVHLIIGFFGLPFDLLLSTDAYYFALLPVAEQIGDSFGISSLATAYSMIVGNIVGTFVSPFSPALWLALGLANLEMGRHIKYSFFWLWGVSIVLLIITFFFGLI
ncbi:MAG TPA: citrate:proton symporter [Pseudogracilibacillus sp.]|nr:citrate:proton symporter [Pseudogracilibacillus sp.]